MRHIKRFFGWCRKKIYEEPLLLLKNWMEEIGVSPKGQKSFLSAVILLSIPPFTIPVVLLGALALVGILVLVKRTYKKVSLGAQ